MKPAWARLLAGLLLCALTSLPPAHAQTALKSLGLSAEEQSWLAARRDRIIRVAVTEVAPLVLRDASAGDYRGMAIDFLHAVEAQLGVRFKVVYYETWADVLAAGRERKAEVLLTTVRTPERESFLRFPTPYVTLRNVLIARRGSGAEKVALGDLAGKSVAVLQSSAAHERLRVEYPALILQPHKDERSVILSVSFAEADYAVVELARTTWAIEKEGLVNLAIVGDTPISYPLSMAVRDDQPLLASVLDKAVKSLPADERERILNKWIHLAQPGLVADPRFWWGLAALAAMWLSILAWNLSLRRRVGERTTILSKQVATLEGLETELRHQADEQRDLAELSSDWFWEQDADLRFTRLWGGGWAKANFDLERSVGKRRWELDVRGVSDEEWAAHKAQLAARETFRNFVLEIRDGLGNWHWVAVSGLPVYDDQGNFSGYRGTASDITQRMLDHHAIEDALTRQRALLDGSSDFLGLLTPDGTLVEVNQEALNFVGTDRGTVIGKPFWETPWWYLPEDPANVHAAIAAAAQGEIVRNLTRRDDKNGVTHWFDYTLSPIYDAHKHLRYLVPQGRDVTDAKRASDALDSLVQSTGAVFGEEFFRRLVNELGAALHVRYVFVGRLLPGATRIGTEALWADGEIVDNIEYDLSGTPCANVMGTSCCTYPNNVQSLFPEDLLLQQMRVESYLGVPIVGVGDVPIGIIVALHDRPLVDTDNGRRLMELFAIRAATEMQRLDEEAKVHQLNLTLEARVEARTLQLEQANRELEAFSYSVSHDLRAPLRHISGFVEMLRDESRDSLGQEALRYLDVIEGATHRMEALIDDLLTFSRLSRTPLSREPVVVREVVDAVIGELAPDCVGRDIDWQIHELPTLQADRKLLRLVFMNLLDNAVKYTRRTAHAVIEIGVLPMDEAHPDPVIFVRDNGVGFDSAYVEKLFGVFQRLHADADFEGTGIGLANVKRIISRHGGQVRAEGQESAGAAFYFTLPDAPSPAGGAGAAAKELDVVGDGGGERND